MSELSYIVGHPVGVQRIAGGVGNTPFLPPHIETGYRTQKRITLNLWVPPIKSGNLYRIEYLFQ